MPASEAAELAAILFEAGCDAVKDDELACDRSDCVVRSQTVIRRLSALCERQKRRGLYVVRLKSATVLPQLLAAQTHGVTVAVMLAPHIDGFDLLHEVRLTHPNLVIISHPAGASPLMAHALAMARLPRLAGADGLILPAPFGLLDIDQATTERTLAALDDLRDAAPVLPVFGGGVNDTVACRLVRTFGCCTALAVGAHFLESPGETVGRVARLCGLLDELVGGT